MGISSSILHATTTGGRSLPAARPARGFHPFDSSPLLQAGRLALLPQTFEVLDRAVRSRPELIPFALDPAGCQQRRALRVCLPTNRPKAAFCFAGSAPVTANGECVTRPVYACQAGVCNSVGERPPGYTVPGHELPVLAEDASAVTVSTTACIGEQFCSPWSLSRSQNSLDARQRYLNAARPAALILDVSTDAEAQARFVRLWLSGCH